MYWYLLYSIDVLFFLPCICTVGYMLLFALFSMRSPIIHRTPRNKFARFLFIVPAFRADDLIMDTVTSIMTQDYGAQDFDLIVVSSGNKPVTNLKLKQHHLSLITTEAQTHGGMLQSAIEQNTGLKLYDMVVVLNVGDIIERDFLSHLNRSRLAGFKIIQSHCMTRHRNTPLEVMEATFEEINNSVFRRGHIGLGMSSGLAASGTAYDYNWFKANVSHFAGGTKEAEAIILKERIMIDYLEEAKVYSLKARSNVDFGTTREEWRSAQIQILKKHLRFLLPAIITHRYDYADKIIQWILVPKTWLVTICCFFSILWPCLYWSVAVKWWLALMLLFFAFALAVPDYLVDDSWLTNMRRMPILAMRNIWAALPRKIPKLSIELIKTTFVKLPFLHRKKC